MLGSVGRSKHPKAGLDFSDDGAYMALAHRQECKDVIRIYSTETWQPLSEFYADTVDMVDLAWSPNGRMLAVWDSNLHYNVLVYSMDGRRLEHYSAYAPTPSPLASAPASVPPPIAQPLVCRAGTRMRLA